LRSRPGCRAPVRLRQRHADSRWQRDGRRGRAADPGTARAARADGDARARGRRAPRAGFGEARPSGTRDDVQPARDDPYTVDALPRGAAPRRGAVMTAARRTPIATLARTEAKLFLREPIALFWGVVFPLVLLIVMGATGSEEASSQYGG